MKTKCLIIDDEPLAVEVIESYLQKLNDFEITAKCGSAVEAFEILQKKHIDLMFLDIQMPELTGLEFLRLMKALPKVIFTTAHREYAEDGFELDAVDYLLKPVSFERFLQALEKFYKLSEPDYKVISTNQSVESDFIYVKENKKAVKIHFNEILYVESLKDYVVIHTDTKKVISKIPISILEEQLPAEKFLRIHRSFIVSISKIDAFTSYSVEIGKKELTIGRTYKNSVLKELNFTKVLKNRSMKPFFKESFSINENKSIDNKVGYAIYLKSELSLYRSLQIKSNDMEAADSPRYYFQNLPTLSSQKMFPTFISRGEKSGIVSFKSKFLLNNGVL